MSIKSFFLSLFLILLSFYTQAKNKRYDSVECQVAKQTYGSVLECGEELFSVHQKSSVEKSLYEICRANFKCKISFEVNARGEVTKIHSAFSKGKKQAQTFPTSFDCKKAKGFAEKTVCQDEELAQLDNQLGAEIKKALDTIEETKKVRDAQKAWISEKRDKCQNRECLLKEYQDRLASFQ